jgi:hypothetical protein
MERTNGIELLNSIIHEDSDRSYSLSVMQYRDPSGKTVRNFGFVERRLRVSNGYWKVAQRHHFGIPLTAWPRICALSESIAQFAKSDGDLYAEFKPSVASIPVTTKHFEESTEHTTEKKCDDPCLDEKRDVVVAPKVKKTYCRRYHVGSIAEEKESKPVEPSTSRKRGRPRKHQDVVTPKRAKKTMCEQDVATQTPVDAPPVAMTTSEQ